MDRFDALSNLEEQTAAAPPQTSGAATPKKEAPPARANASISKPASKTHHDTVAPRHHDTMSDTTVSRNHDAGEQQADEDIAEVVRKAVKHFGKEAATHRFTLEEKNLLADIEYTYRRQGIKTSENEITRIAINYFIEDYRRKGEESLLAAILKLINS